MMRKGRGILACIVLMFATASSADHADNWGPAVGSPAPAIEAKDQTGAARDFANLTAKNGVLLFFNRSVDW